MQAFGEGEGGAEGVAGGEDDGGVDEGEEAGGDEDLRGRMMVWKDDG